MSNTKRKKKGRFIGIPYNIATSEPFAKLKPPATKLLLDLLTQYTGSNNGMLSPCHSLMKERGWAKSSLYRAYSSLVHSGFIVVTRQGQKIRGFPTLIAVTWNGIDEPRKCQYDYGIKVSPVPLSCWCKHKTTWEIEPTIKPP